MKVKCLPLGGLGRGGTLFLGGRAGMSCFRLKGSSTKPYIKSQWKGEAEGRYQGIRCKPRKLWVEHQSKTTSYVMLQTSEKVKFHYGKNANITNERYHYLRHLAEVCKSAIAAECTAPERVQSTKEIWNRQRKIMKHASSMVKCVHGNKYHTKCISKQPVIVLKSQENGKNYIRHF